HRPTATQRISTSPVLGGSRSISAISKSLPSSRRTAALVFMRPPALCLVILRGSCPGGHWRTAPRMWRRDCDGAGLPDRHRAGGLGVAAGGQLQLGAVVGRVHREFRAVAGDDLPYPVRRQRAQQVVGGGEQLPGGGPGPRVGQQL